MKNIILTILFSLICCIGFAQTKKSGSTKKLNNDSAANGLLRQEKIWPVLYKNSKNKAGTGIKAGTSFDTGNRL